MPNELTGEISWYRPDPRAVILLHNFHCSKSLNKIIRKQIFSITFNKAFTEVVKNCGSRKNTWINNEILSAYTRLHYLGNAHSVEVWRDGKIAGGVYGASFGAVFFAESMFYRITNASKIALFFLVQRLIKSGYILLECQFMTDHLRSLGAIEFSDYEYMSLLNKVVNYKVYF